MRVLKLCCVSRLHKALAKADKNLARLNPWPVVVRRGSSFPVPLVQHDTVGRCPVINFHFPLKRARLAAAVVGNQIRLGCATVGM